MATQAGTSGGTNHKYVGTQFVQHYYNTLKLSPWKSYSLYHEESTLSRPDHDGELVSMTSRKAISEFYLSTEMKRFSLKLENVDTQPSLGGNVFVFVTGSFTKNHSDKYKFAQSFLLAPQADGAYFILNDVLRYFLEVPPTNEALVGHDNVNTNAESGPVPAGPGISSVIDKDSSEKRSAQAKNDVSMIPDATPATVKSYASVLKVKDQAEGVQESSSVPARTTVRPVSDADQSYSICVKNLPSNVKIEVVHAEFSKFGSIKPSGIQVVQNQHNSIAFIAYESEKAMDEAIEARTVWFGSYRSTVEKKRRKENSVFDGVNRGNNSNARGNRVTPNRSYQINNFNGQGTGFSNNRNRHDGNSTRNESRTQEQYSANGRGAHGNYYH